MENINNNNSLTNPLNITISNIAKATPHYKVYTVNLGESKFIVKKKGDFMWVGSEVVKQHGADVLDHVGRYIDKTALGK